ncbi:MAG: hypothetical protein IRZ18_00320 [Clostridia bacterium]|nr:hypothetical protein [Clostridia bacterium]
MRHLHRRLPWGRHAPPAAPVAWIVLAVVVVLCVLHWVWATVVGVYFSSMIVIPWYGGHPPDLGALVFRALRRAAEVTMLVFLLLAAIAGLAWQIWGRGHPVRRRW